MGERLSACSGMGARWCATNKECLQQEDEAGTIAACHEGFFVTLLVVCVGICGFAEGANVRDSLNDRASVSRARVTLGSYSRQKGPSKIQVVGIRML